MLILKITHLLIHVGITYEGNSPILFQNPVSNLPCDLEPVSFYNKDEKHYHTILILRDIQDIFRDPLPS